MTFEKYLAALSVLGLEPGATIEDVRREWKAIMLTCHPDRFPGDDVKAARAKEANNARDDLEAISKARLMERYGTQAEYDRRTGTTSGSSSGTFLMNIFAIVAPAGFGKTFSWARSQRRPRGARNRVPTHVILASPTVDLMGQTFALLKENGVTHATIIHSKNTTGGVHQAVMKYHGAIKNHPHLDAILLVSHAEILHHPLPPEPKDWDLVLDEVPDCVGFLTIDGPFTHRHLTRYLSAVPSLNQNLYQLVPSGKPGMDRLIKIAGNRNPFDGGLEHYKAMAAAVIAGHALLVPRVQYDDLIAEDEYRKEFRGHLDVMVIVPPIWFQQYHSVTMMGARIHSHFTALVWKKVWNVNFQDDDRFHLPQRHTVAQSRLLTIHYIFQERVSRGFLAKKTADGETLFQAACQSVATFYDGEDFLWSAPRDGDDKQYGVADRFWTGKKPRGFRPSLRLPGKTHGLNKPEFMQTRNVALLSVVQFSPAQFAMLQMLGLTEAEINKAMSFDQAYQDMMRCALRQDRGGAVPRIANRSHAVDVTVMDKATADDMALEFSGCRVMPYPDELVPKVKERKARTETETEQRNRRSRQFRARQAAHRQDVDDKKSDAA